MGPEQRGPMETALNPSTVTAVGLDRTRERGLASYTTETMLVICVPGGVPAWESPEKRKRRVPTNSERRWVRTLRPVGRHVFLLPRIDCCRYIVTSQFSPSLLHTH